MKPKKHLPKKSLSDQNEPSLTVVIPTLNEIAYLPILLNALDMQTRLPDEVIVADAGSTDGTAELARSRGARVVSGGMPAVGRNAGAHVAGGDLLLFLDADVLPLPDFIARVLKEFEHKEFDAATCFIAALGGNHLDRTICTGTNLYFRIIQPVSPHAPGFCILSKRLFHEKMGGFDESLTLSEDIDYARRAKRCGKFVILTSARIPVSMRRLGKEGLVRLGLKYAWCEIYALMGKPVREAPFEYEFGTFSPPKMSNHLEFFQIKSSPQQWSKLGYSLRRLIGNVQEQLNR